MGVICQTDLSAQHSAGLRLSLVILNGKRCQVISNLGNPLRQLDFKVHFIHLRIIIQTQGSSLLRSGPSTLKSALNTTSRSTLLSLAGKTWKNCARKQRHLCDSLTLASAPLSPPVSLSLTHRTALRCLVWPPLDWQFLGAHLDSMNNEQIDQGWAHGTKRAEDD